VSLEEGSATPLGETTMDWQTQLITVYLTSNGQMLCTGVGSGGDFLDVFLNSILEHDSLDDLG
jgi:hypothetical protein